MKLRKPLAAVLAALAVTGASAGCAQTTSASSAATDSLTIGVVDSTGSSVDFLTAAHGTNAGEAVWDFWVRWKERDTGRTFVPDAATSWKFSSDHKQLTLTVRDGIVFSDGTKLDNKVGAEELQYFIDHPSLSGLSGDGAVSAKAAGTDQVVVTFSYAVEDYWILDALYSGAPVFSPNYLGKVDTLAQDPVGSGPYVYDKTASTAGSVYVFEKNQHYWDSAEYPYRKLTIKYFTSTTSALNALKSGQIDFTKIDTSQASQVTASSGLHLVTETGGWSGLVLDHAGTGGQRVLADVRVRQAISMAFDRESIVKDLLSGYGEINNQIFTTGQAEYQADSLGLYSYNVAEAKKLLSEAGYPHGFTMTIPMLSGNAYEAVIQDSLAAIGITVKYREFTDVGSWIAAVKSGKYLAFYFPVGFQASVDFYIAPQPSGQLNPYGKNTAQVAQLLNERSFGDASVSAKASQELGKYVLDEAWFAVWAHTDTLYASRKGLSVATNNISGIDPFLVSFQPAS